MGQRSRQGVNIGKSWYDAVPSPPIPLPDQSAKRFPREPSLDPTLIPHTKVLFMAVILGGLKSQEDFGTFTHYA